MTGRGRPLRPWVQYVRQFLVEESERLSQLGTKITSQVLIDFAHNALRIEGSQYDENSICTTTNRPISDQIDSNFIERLCELSNLVRRFNSGNKKRSEAFTERTEKNIAFFLGNISREFQSGALDENCVENVDEGHFLYDLDDRYCSAKRGSRDINYLGMVSGSEGVTVVLRVTGGSNSKLASPFFIFRNRLESYSMNGSLDNDPSVSYRTQKNGWMDSTRFVQWLRERRAIGSLPENEHRVLFLDNYSGHNMNDAVQTALSEINTSLRYFPANAIYLCQPLGSLLIQQFKQA